MSLHTEWMRYGKDEEYLGYLAKPSRARGALPVVLVIQEIWGADEHIQDVANRFAKAGYVAFSPDLYAKGGERSSELQPQRVEAVKGFLNTLAPTAWGNSDEREAALAKLPGDEGRKVGETFRTLFGGLNLDLYVPQLLETTRFLREECAHSKGQPVVSVGFCMGGGLSARLACADEQLKGAAIFYGHAPSTEQIARVSCPVRGFYGSLDTGITSVVPDFAARMKEAGKDFEYVVYEDAHHAFFNDTRESYHADASRDAFARVLSFFAEQTKRL